MTYTLKSPQYDLSRHKAGTPYRYKHGWIKIGGPPTGKHLTASDDIEARAQDIAGTTFDGHVKRLEGLMKQVQSNDSSITVDEEAWHEVAERLDAMKQIATSKSKGLSVEKKQMIRAATGAAVAGGIRYAIKEHLPRKAVEMGKEFGSETVGTARDSAIHTAAIWGSNFAASAASLLGAQQSAHFVEAFHRLLENPAVEVGFTAAAAVLISALISRIRSALTKRRDRKIAKARGLRLTGDNPVKGKP